MKKNNWRFEALARAKIVRQEIQEKGIEKLLETCKAIVEGGNIDCGTYWKVDIEDINKLKQTIAKAEGKEA